MCNGLNPDIKSWSSSSAFELKVNSLSHETLLFHNQMWFWRGGDHNHSEPQEEEEECVSNVD